MEFLCFINAPWRINAYTVDIIKLILVTCDDANVADVKQSNTVEFSRMTVVVWYETVVNWSWSWARCAQICWDRVTLFYNNFESNEQFPNILSVLLQHIKITQDVPWKRCFIYRMLVNCIMSSCTWLKFKYKINKIKSPHKTIHIKKSDHRGQIDKKFHEMKHDAAQALEISVHYGFRLLICLVPVGIFNKQD